MKKVIKYENLIIVGLDDLIPQAYDEIFELMQTNALVYFGMKKDQRKAEMVCCLINYLNNKSIEELLEKVNPSEIIIVYEERPDTNLEFLSLAS